MNYFITNELPTAEEFVQLRVDTGLSFRSVEVSSLALLKSVYFVGLRAKEDNKLIAMGLSLSFQMLPYCRNFKATGLEK